MTVPTPADLNAVRLAALAEYDLVDVSPERDFDGLTALAARALGVPAALLSLFDGAQQRLKSRHGPAGWEAPVALCQRVIADEAPVVIEDLRAADPRPEGAAEGFYAGVPLRTMHGLVLGTLCAIDRAPRPVAPHDVKTLTLLAGQCVALLELRRSERLRRARRSSLEIYRHFFEFGGELHGALEPQTGKRWLNQAWEDALGWPREAMLAMPMFELVHPEDRPVVAERIKRLLAGERGERYDEIRFMHRDGHWVPIAWSTTAAGGVIYTTGRDLSVQREKEAALAASEGRLRALFESLDEGVVMHANSGEIVACNPAAERILGLTRDQLLGRTPIDPRWQSVGEDGTAIPGEMHPAMETLRTGEPATNVRMGVRLPAGALRWISVNVRPLRNADGEAPYGVFSTFRDVTDTYAAERR